MENEIKNSITFIDNKTDKESGFSCPSNYFDNLEDVITTKIAEENIPQENAFKIPETYFNNLEDAILSQISSKKKTTKVISLKERLLKIAPYVAAASIVLFIGFNSFVFNSDEKLTLDNLSDNDFEYWLDTNTLDANDIAAILEDEIKDENEFSFTEIKNESIENYIDNIDNTSLLNELN